METLKTEIYKECKNQVSSVEQGRANILMISLSIEFLPKLILADRNHPHVWIYLMYVHREAPTRDRHRLPSAYSMQ